ncbi:MAG: hypothetical protein P8179_11650 [Candidatus Thiodiazotropha sp.]|jgi:hypothetical protein
MSKLIYVSHNKTILEVWWHLAQGRTHFNYLVADGGKFKTYQFMVDKEESIASRWHL